MDKFVHLHLHTEYSLLDGYGHPQTFIHRVKELGQPAAAVTDHGSISAHRRWFKHCKNEGVKPILGCEMYVSDDVKKKERAYYHITVLAKNDVGLKNLNHLITLSYREGFYYKPKVDWEMFKRYSKGLIVTSGCPSGKTGEMIKSGAKDKDVIDELKRQQNIFEDFFVELCPWDFDEGRHVAEVIHRCANKLKIPIVGTMDCHYPMEVDHTAQDVLLCIQTGGKMSDPNRMKFDQKDFYVKSRTTMEHSFKKVFPKSVVVDVQKWLNNSVKIADMVDFDFPQATPVQFPFRGDKEKKLWSMLNHEMIKRNFSKNKEYKQRLKREFDLVVEKDFVDYFLVVTDLVQWAKSNGIFVGPARGSSCGSLMCFLLHITEIDPMPFGLLFDRFIDINRTDLPDIDIDFEDARRDEVKNYLKEKYGHDKVSGLATYSTFKGKYCLQDVGRIFEIPYSVIEELKKYIIQRSGADSRASLTLEDTFNEFEQARKILQEYPEFNYAKLLEGQIRNRSQHAAGIVIANEPIENFAAIIGKQNDETISMDYDDIKDVGLLKIDILGLTTMTVLRRCIDAIKKNHGIVIDLNRLPLNDESVYSSFQQGRVFGIFQFDGDAATQVCRQLKPKDFGELTAVNALARPGSLHSGGTTSFIQRKFGIEQIEYLHPIYDTITKETYGVVVYQEQVMLVVREMGKFDWSTVSTVRKIMSKRTGVESFNQYMQDFIKGAKTNGVDAKLAESIWLKMCTFGSWAFNKSHAVAYTHIGYWMMWLKVHYPIEFYVSCLESESDENKQRRTVKEFIRDGGVLLPPHVNKSKKFFSQEGKALRIGFDAVKGIGEKVSEPLVAHQPYASRWSLRKAIKKESAVNTLISIGACNGLKVGHEDDMTGDLFPKDDPEINEHPTMEMMSEICPIMLQDAPREKWLPWVKKWCRVEPLEISTIPRLESNRDVYLIGHTNIKTHNLKNKVEESESRGREFDTKGQSRDKFDLAIITLEDETMFINCYINWTLYPKVKGLIWELKTTDTLLVKAKYLQEKGSIVFASSMVHLEELKRKLETKQPFTPMEREFISHTVIR